jgi:pimeloyl-ACP methyl ester carboxylesterase
MKLSLVAGTWAWEPTKPDNVHWWQPSSAFCGVLTRAQLELVSSKRPFIWTTNANGIFENKHLDWRAGGVNLYAYLVPDLCPDKRIPPAETMVIAHSHGGQVALYAAAEGLKIDTLITVATPVRSDMSAIIEAARPNIRHWRHIHGSWKDYVQIAGSLGDGTFSFRRAFKQANENIEVRGAAHSDFINQAQYFPRWEREWLTIK